MPKFKKQYTETTVDKTISFFKKRLSKKEDSRICEVMPKIILECDENTRNKIILHLNKFSKWYSKYYEKLPNKEYKMAYFKYVCTIWRNRNNKKWIQLGLDKTKQGTDVMTHLSNMFAALFRSERYNLYDRL